MTEDATNNKNAQWVWAALIAILILGVALRLHHLGESSLWYDETASIRMGEKCNSVLDFLNPEVINEAPMMALQAKVWVGIVEVLGFGDKISETRDFMIRLLPALWSILSILVIFVLGRDLFKKDEPALFAALFLAVSPLHLIFAQELRIYSFYVFVSLLAAYFMHKALFRGRWYDWMCMSLFFSVLVYSHFIAIWTVFAFNLAFLWYLYLQRKNLRPWFIANFAMMLIILPALNIAYHANAQLSDIEYAWFPKPTIKIAMLTFKSFFAGYGATSWAYWPLFLMGMTLFPIGAAALYFNGRKFSSGLLLTVGLFPVLFNNVFWRFHGFSFYEHRSYIVSGTALLMLLAYGISAIPIRPVRYAVCAVFVLLCSPMIYNYQSHQLHPLELHRIAVWDKVDYRDTTKLLREKWQEGDFLAYVGHFNVFSMKYYFPGEQHVIAVEPLYIREMYKSMGAYNLELFPELKPVLIEDLLPTHKRVWFLRSKGITFEWQPNSEVAQAWLDSHLKRKESFEFPGLTLTLFEK